MQLNMLAEFSNWLSEANGSIVVAFFALMVRIGCGQVAMKSTEGCA
jgi:hypothetical protein